MRSGRLNPIAIVAVFIAVAAFLVLFNRSDSTPVPDSPPPARPNVSSTPSTATTSAASAQEQPASDHAELHTIADPDERREVEKTLALIDRGGPFEHRQDGSVFSNREGRLPQKPRGYYREYTVETPGATTRGARRIVRGSGGETYYTNDHYGTFVRLE